MALDTITPTIIRALHTQFSRIYQTAYDEAPVFYDRMCTSVPSSSKSNTYGWMAKIPKMREWLGERTVHGIASHGFQVVNKKFELTIGVDRDDFEDENLGIYQPLLQQMGYAARKQPDDLLIDLLQNGHTADAECFDGQNFFDTDHPIDKFAGTGTQSNYKTSTAFSEDNLFSMIALMAGYQGEDGRPLGVRPNLVVGPPALEKIFRKTLSASTIASGADNVARGIVDYVIIPELAGEDTTWYLLDTRKPIKPFVFQPRRAPEFVQRTSVSDSNVFEHDRYEWGVSARNNIGYGPWFLALKAAA